MDNKAYFIMVHDRLKNNSTLKSGGFLPCQKEMDHYRKQVESEKKRQDEFFEKQKTTNNK
jgi:hypothetical protein